MSASLFGVSQMGVVVGIDHESFPEQSSVNPPGTKVKVCFKYNVEHTLNGEIVRNDIVEPFVGIIRLVDGRYVLMSECMYSTVR